MQSTSIGQSGFRRTLTWVSRTLCKDASRRQHAWLGSLHTFINSNAAHDARMLARAGTDRALDEAGFIAIDSWRQSHVTGPKSVLFTGTRVFRDPLTTMAFTAAVGMQVDTAGTVALWLSLQAEGVGPFKTLLMCSRNELPDDAGHPLWASMQLTRGLKSGLRTADLSARTAQALQELRQAFDASTTP